MEVSIEKKPYVLSEEFDLWLPDKDFLIQRNQIEPFRCGLEDDLRAMGKNVEWVSSDLLRQGINERIARTALPVVSLDDRYVTDADAFLGVSRGVDENLEGSGYAPRVGYESIDEQLQQIQRLGQREIVVVDDVLFSGGVVAYAAEQLQPYGIEVKSVICGVAVGEGVEAMTELGVEVDAVVYYDEVEDEICERDATALVGSGRRIASIGRSALYFDPIYGRPTEWMSIGVSDVKSFAVNNYRRNLSLIRGGSKKFMALKMARLICRLQKGSIS